jgi:excisionase family DNA binding protein
METYFTIEEAAKYLGYAEKTIRKWVLNREIPFHKIHKTIRFRLSEIEKWVDWSGGLPPLRFLMAAKAAYLAPQRPAGGP